MKKFRTFLILLLVLTLTACAFPVNSLSEPVDFYYPRKEKEYIYGSDSSVLATETREAAGHSNDLVYLLALYLQGPTDEMLRTPFPAGTFLISARKEDAAIQVELSSAFVSLAGADQTLACAALAQTCFGCTDAQTVTICATDDKTTVSITMDRNGLILSDSSTQTETTQ